MFIVVGLIILMSLVVIHELGHFIAAKKSGVKVLEFGLGIPPKVCKLWTDKSGTEYTLNLLPLGGFVRLKGENLSDPEEFLAKDSFLSKSVWKKLPILLGGVTMNLVLAWLIFVIVFFVGIRPIFIIPDNVAKIKSQSYIMAGRDFLKAEGILSGEDQSTPVLISDVMLNSISEKMGMMSGDTILSINNVIVDSLTISQVLQSNIGKKINVLYSRGINTLSGSSICPEDSCLLGIAFESKGNTEVNEIKFPLVGAMKAATRELKAEFDLTIQALGNLGKGLVSFNKEKTKQAVSKMSGPVGAITFGRDLFKYRGYLVLLAFIGMISFSLAIFNILPIPALDGGRTIGVLIQSIFRLKPEKYFVIENYFNLVFFVALLGLGIYVIFMDLGVISRF